MDITVTVKILIKILTDVTLKIVRYNHCISTHAGNMDGLRDRKKNLEQYIPYMITYTIQIC